MRKFPRLAIESFVDGVTDPQSFRVLSNILQNQQVYGGEEIVDVFPILATLRSNHEHIKRLVTTEYWPFDTDGENGGEILEEDLERLGASKVHISNLGAKSTYAFMSENGIDAVPVTDRNGRFLGMASKASIGEDVVSQMLGVRSSNSSDVKSSTGRGDILAEPTRR